MQDAPSPSWIRARKAEDGGVVPQIIAHRGFRAQHPENTLQAFAAAVAAGAHALETDVHLTRDDVVVLSHDPTLQRCFGRPEAIVNLDWRDIAPLRTRAPPHLPMPRLDELLAFLVRPENAHVWLLLDIKSDNDADLVMRRIAAAIATVPPLSGRPWHQRILLGVWELGFLPACQRALPLFPISHIGISLSYARRFLDEPSMAALNLFVYALLVPPLGRLLVRRAHRRHKAVFAWTVDEPALLRLCMREGIDGIVTDDPLRVRAERQAWLRAGRRGPVESAYGWRKWVFGTWILCVAWWFTHWFLWTVRREGATRRRRNNPRADAAVEMS